MIVDPAVYRAGWLNVILGECRIYAKPDPLCDVGLVYPPWVDVTIHQLVVLMGASVKAGGELW